MLVTVGVLAVLATIGIYYIGGAREGATRSVAEDNLNFLNKAVTAYNQSNRNVAETLGSGATELGVVALLQTYDAANPTPGTPYLSPSMPCNVTASTNSYRAQWNGNFFQIIEKGSSGSGIDLGALAGSVD